MKYNKALKKWITLVNPNTILYKWQKLIKKRWDFSSHKSAGRKPISAEIKSLIINMKNNNILWGYGRIAGELMKLGIDVSRTTIARIIQDARRKGQIKIVGSWKTFLKSHWKSLFACDFLTVDTIAFKRFYVFFILQLKTRKIVQFGITRHPNRQFVSAQLSNLRWDFENDRIDLIHDNSGELKYFDYKIFNINSVNTTPYSPNMNAFASALFTPSMG